MITTAVIMAAGKGTRFGSMTETRPKGFIEFKGIPMVVRSIENLISAGIDRIVIGTGYHREWYESLSKEYPQIQTVYSPLYAETNSMETLARCKDAIGEDDFLLLESDIVYERKALSSLLGDRHRDVMLATPVVKFQDQYYIGCDGDGYLTKCSTDREEIVRETGANPVGELVGIHKISNVFYRNMLSAYEHIKISKKGDRPEKTGYEFIIEDVAVWTGPTEGGGGENGRHAGISTHGLRSACPLYVLVEENLRWYEIDDERDLKFACDKIALT